MKKVIFIGLILIINIFILKAEDSYYYHKLTYDDFVTWVKTIKIPGYTFSQSKTEGSEEVYNIEYVAIFVKDNDFIQVRIGHPDVFYQYEDPKALTYIGPYQLDGFPAVFIYNLAMTKPQNVTYLLIRLESLDATFSITALTKTRLTQVEMEDIFRKFNLSKLGLNDKSTWPKEIPLSIRVPGTVLSIEKLPNNDNSLEVVYSVKISKDNQFVLDLKKFYKEMRGWLDLQTFKDNTLVCNTTTDMKVLEKLRNGDTVEFIYYIK